MRLAAAMGLWVEASCRLASGLGSLASDLGMQMPSIWNDCDDIIDEIYSDLYDESPARFCINSQPTDIYENSEKFKLKNQVAVVVNGSKFRQCNVCDLWFARRQRWCERCRNRIYCSKECQIAAWPTHKPYCFSMRGNRSPCRGDARNSVNVVRHCKEGIEAREGIITNMQV